MLLNKVVAAVPPRRASRAPQPTPRNFARRCSSPSARFYPLRAGEFGSRSGLARSAGHRSLVFSERRRDRGRLFFGYFLLAKQKKVPRPRFGNRNYIY